jgi:short-subunit dehydrogenase
MPRERFTNGGYSAHWSVPEREDRDSGTHLELFKRITMMTKPSTLITGASTGIGAVYADRVARRGHDLVLVARDRARVKELADRRHRETGVAVEVLRVDLSDTRGLTQVGTRLSQDTRIGSLVNNAGLSDAGGFLDQSADDVTRIVNLNAMALLRFAHAVAPRFAEAGGGPIINVSSVLALAPEYGFAVYRATKAFVRFLSQSLQLEVAPKGVYVRAVLPAVTRTEIWEHSDKDVTKLPALMEVDELVDAALAGFDRREKVTIPSLPDADQWTVFDAVRTAMIPNLNQVHAAACYRHLAA